MWRNAVKYFLEEVLVFSTGWTIALMKAALYPLFWWAEREEKPVEVVTWDDILAYNAKEDRPT